MADTMQFDLVSPERSLVSVPVREVRLPGNDGDLTAMPGHAPTIVTLRPGLVTVVAENGTETEFAVTGGFVEIGPDSISLLAERGHPREEISQEIFNEMMTDAHRQRLPGLCRLHAPLGAGRCGSGRTGPDPRGSAARGDGSDPRRLTRRRFKGGGPPAPAWPQGGRQSP